MAFIQRCLTWRPGLFRFRLLDRTRLFYLTVNEGAGPVNFALILWRKGAQRSRYFAYIYLFGQSWHCQG